VTPGRSPACTSLYGWLRRRLSVPATIVVSGLAFTAEHAVAPLVLPAALLFGIAAGWVRHRTGSTLDTFVMHALFDGTLLVVAAVLVARHVLVIARSPRRRSRRGCPGELPACLRCRRGLASGSANVAAPRRARPRRPPVRLPSAEPIEVSSPRSCSLRASSPCTMPGAMWSPSLTSTASRCA
jgi:hypothetical protein